jgi:hypothetical protein
MVFKAGFASSVIGQTLRDEPTQFAVRRITRDLPVPFGSVRVHQPLAELRKFVRIELEDLLLQLFDSGHGHTRITTRIALLVID